MTKQSKPDRKQGGQAGNQNAAKEETAVNATFKLYADDRQILAALLADGYETDKTKCVRRALREALQRA